MVLASKQRLKKISNKTTKMYPDKMLKGARSIKFRVQFYRG